MTEGFIIANYSLVIDRTAEGNRHQWENSPRQPPFRDRERDRPRPIFPRSDLRCRRPTAGGGSIALRVVEALKDAKVARVLHEGKIASLPGPSLLPSFLPYVCGPVPLQWRRRQACRGSPAPAPPSVPPSHHPSQPYLESRSQSRALSAVDLLLPRARARGFN